MSNPDSTVEKMIALKQLHAQDTYCKYHDYYSHRIEQHKLTSLSPETNPPLEVIGSYRLDQSLQPLEINSRYIINIGPLATRTRASGNLVNDLC
jgi:hypothetical protein